jgi:hypothetical protein
MRDTAMSGSPSTTDLAGRDGRPSRGATGVRVERAVTER